MLNIVWVNEIIKYLSLPLNVFVLMHTIFSNLLRPVMMMLAMPSYTIPRILIDNSFIFIVVVVVGREGRKHIFYVCSSRMWIQFTCLFIDNIIFCSCSQKEK